MSILSLSQRLTLTSLGALALAATAPSLPAHAQDHDQYGGGDDITVYAPHYQQRDPYTGAPIDIARESRPVYYGDLDLNSARGVRILSIRVHRAAVQLCSYLDWSRGVIPVDSNADCVARTVDRAMYQAPMRDDLRDRFAEAGYRD